MEQGLEDTCHNRSTLATKCSISPYVDAIGSSMFPSSAAAACVERQFIRSVRSLAGWLPWARGLLWPEEFRFLQYS